MINCKFKTITLNDRVYPAVGFGTFPFKDETCRRVVEDALAIGYRIFDTATFYNNFKPIGVALKKVPRQEVYLISKVWPDAHTFKMLNIDIHKNLEELGTPYLDGYLLHWPNSDVPIEATMAALYEIKDKGLIKDIGMSNITVNHLKRLEDLNLSLSCVQVEMNPLFCDFKLLKFCQTKKINIQAWAPLARGRAASNALLNEIGNRYNKTSAQVAIRWIVQHGCIPLPASQNIQHISLNFDVNDFFLTSEEMEDIDAQAKRGQRERLTLEAGLGFSDEFDLPYEECWPK